MRLKFYTETKCNYCGQISNNQPSGDGCHTCLRGIMEKEGVLK
jgi:hypothetical protein